MKYFVYDPDDGISFYESEQQAEVEAERALIELQENGADFGFGDDDADVCWGVVKAKAQFKHIAHRPPKSEIDEHGFDKDGNNWRNGFARLVELELIKEK